MEARPSRLSRALRHPWTWVGTTYFAEGYPYSIVHNLAEVLFKELGASLGTIGLTALYHLPWNLKFLWGPHLDRFLTKRKWIVLTEAAVAALLLGLVWAVGSANVLVAAAIVFGLLAVVSATHDIAIDGFYLEALDTSGQSRFVGARVTAYRISTLFVTGFLVLFVARWGWRPGALLAALVMLVLLAYHATHLPATEREAHGLGELARGFVRPVPLTLAGLAIVAAVFGPGLVRRLPRPSLPEPLAKLSPAEWIGLGLLAVLAIGAIFVPYLRRRLGASRGFYARAFVDFLDQPRIGWILAFVVLFRCGESFLLKMRYPFFRDIGLSMEQYALQSGTFGIIASFSGSILGGTLIARDGLRRWIWPFVLAQNVLNLLFAGLAWAHPVGGVLDRGGLVATAAVIVVEAFGAGLGTAVFMVYLMRCTKPSNRAAHMAIVTALMSVSFTLAGVASGYLAERLGFAAYFAFTFVATIPAMALIALLPNLDEPPKNALAQ